jgi:2-polyprenyl-6-methoxyphenol hydroxylase-like FAD-dependent oxidoreductase
MSQLRRGAPTVAFADDVIGQHPDRQVLVVGDTIVGYTLALLLGRAGFDPLLATASDAYNESGIVSLRPAVVRALEGIGVELSALECTRIDSVSVQSATPSKENTTVTSRRYQADEEGLVVVSTRDLHRVLEESAAGNLRAIDRRIETLSYRDDGLVVKFDDGIREWLDVVIYADGSDTADQTREPGSRDPTSLTQHEVCIDGKGPQRDETRCIERWTRDAHLQSVPRPGGSRLLRITVPHGTTIEQAASELDSRSYSVGQAPVKASLSDAESSTVSQASIREQRIDHHWWGDGRICRCGQAAYPMAPAVGDRISAGIEDALAFVAELSDGDRLIANVVTAYAKHRARHFLTLVRTIRRTRSNEDYLDLIPSCPPLHSVGLLRTVSLAPLLDETLYRD